MTTTPGLLEHSGYRRGTAPTITPHHFQPIASSQSIPRQILVLAVVNKLFGEAGVLLLVLFFLKKSSIIYLFNFFNNIFLFVVLFLVPSETLRFKIYSSKYIRRILFINFVFILEEDFLVS